MASGNEQLGSTEAPNPGEVVAGKYRVDRVLGKGGMGVVVAATHLDLDRVVAIKFLLLGDGTRSDAAERFSREARITAKLRSEHVVQVTDTGTLENGVPYMVMEYLQGYDLRRVCRAGGVACCDAVDYIMQAAEGLAEAHGHGIVHRDLKPGNLFVAERADGSPVVKVVDFGISKFKPEGEEKELTSTTALMGSPVYMSPEQLLSSKHVDARTDIWALGGILFELIVGSTAFKADTLPELCTLIINCAPRRLDEIKPDAPPQLVAAIARCLEKPLDRRYQNLADFATDIACFGGPQAVENLRRIRKHLGLAEASSPSVPSGAEPFAPQPTAGAVPPSGPNPAWPTDGEAVPPSGPSTPYAISGAAMATSGSAMEAPVASGPVTAQTAGGAPPAEIVGSIERANVSMAYTARRSRVGAWIGVVGGLLLVGAGAAWFAFRDSGSNSASALGVEANGSAVSSLEGAPTGDTVVAGELPAATSNTSAITATDGSGDAGLASLDAASSVKPKSTTVVSRPQPYSSRPPASTSPKPATSKPPGPKPSATSSKGLFDERNQ